MSTVTHSRTLDLIEEGYITPDISEVRGFLTDRPDIADVLAEALSVIPRYFGENTAMTLRVQDDPDEERRYIAAYIRTGPSAKEALNMLHQAKLTWWLDSTVGLREEVLLSLDLV